MADRIKGITVEIGGDTQGLDKALSDVNSTSRSLQRELNDVNRLLRFDPSNVEALAQKQRLLNQQVENTTEKLNRLKQVEQEVENQFRLGDISEEQFRAFRREIGFTERELGNLRDSLDNIGRADTAPAERGLHRLRNAAKEAKDQIKEIGSGMAGLGAGAIGGVLALVTGMQDYNEVLARLRTNSAMAGKDLGIVEGAFSKIVAITGEADSAGETLANLLASGFSDQQLSEVIDNVNGAYIKFSDTLKTEGIADGIQETFATGKAIGMFAELLDRSGVNVTDFNDKLAATKTDGEKANLILQTMKDQGLAGITEKYQELNPEVQASAEANASLMNSLGELAIVFAPIVAQVTDFVTKMVEWAAANPGVTTTVVAIVAAIGTLVAICLAFAPVLALITTLSTALNIGMLPITLTILAIVAVIALAIAAGIAIYKNWDKIKAGATELAATIKQKFEEFKAAATQKLEEAKTKIETTWNNVMSFFRGINLNQIGKDVIQGLINGITSMGNKVREAAGKIANGISEKVKSILRLGSPSKVMIGMGEDTGDGFAIGLEHSINQIKNMAGEMASTAIPNIKANQTQTTSTPASSRNLTVNITSPKALNAREANVVWNRTMKKMQLQW